MICRKNKGLPGYWGFLCKRAVVYHPAGPSLARQYAHKDAAFSRCKTLGTGMAVISGL